MQHLIGRPTEAEYADFYANYVRQTTGDDILAILEKSKKETLTFFKAIPDEKWDYRYAENKWSIRELWLHLIDAERVFAYRMLRASRGDQTPLPGFDENAYVPNSNAANRSVGSLLEEYLAVRAATIVLVKNCTKEQFLSAGIGSNAPFTPRSVAFIIAGHEKHHQTIIKERYL